MTKIRVSVVNHDRPVIKFPRDYDHDMMTVEVPAGDLIAGDLVPGLGILDAILAIPGGGRSHTLLLCSGETAWEHAADDEIDCNPAMCKVCAMHPTDCDEFGCDV